MAWGTPARFTAIPRYSPTIGSLRDIGNEFPHIPFGDQTWVVGPIHMIGIPEKSPQVLLVVFNSPGAAVAGTLGDEEPLNEGLKRS